MTTDIATQHQAPFKGLLWDFGLEDERAGFPKGLAVLRSWPDADLKREQRALLKASFSNIFGHNARRALALIEQVIAERAAINSTEGTR